METSKKLALGILVLRVRARLDMTQQEFLEIKIRRTIISGWKNDFQKPRRVYMAVLEQKLPPYLRPEELAALEEFCS